MLTDSCGGDEDALGLLLVQVSSAAALAIWSLKAFSMADGPSSA
jgi:hypothetical protein